MNNFTALKMEVAKEEKPDISVNTFHGTNPISERTSPIKRTDGDVMNDLVTDEIEVKDEYETSDPQLLQDMKNENVFRCLACNPDTLYANNQQNTENHTDSKCFKCCNYSCNRQALLDSRTVTHDAEGRFECDICAFKTFINSSLDMHVKALHNSKKPYKCTTCDYSSSRKETLNNHMAVIHGIGRRFQCSTCGFRTFYKNRLVIHVRIHNSDKPYKCIACNYSNNRREGLKHHIVVTHGTGGLCECFICGFKTFYKRHLVTYVKIHSGEKHYKCTSCDYSSIRKYSLKIHVATTHGIRGPFECFGCGFKTFYKSHLATHVKTHSSEKPYKCTTCDYSSSRKAHLKIHMAAAHWTGGRFECFTCGFKTFHKSSLLTHLNIHSSDKPYKCTVCDYSSSGKANLKIHMAATHGAGGRFECFTCGFKTFYKSHFAAHVKIHSVVKPYKCADCNYSSSGKANLKIHVASTHKTGEQSECFTCGFNTFSKVRLSKHIWIHRSKKLYKCTACDYSVIRKQSLDSHMITIHGN